MPVAAAGPGWTDQRVSDLRSLWAAGWTASQIAARLGGCTRNAVIGKVHRLGLARRATTSRSRSGPGKQYQRNAASTPWRGPAKPKQPRAPKKDLGFDFAPLTDAAAKATIGAVPAEDAAINRRPLAELELDDCRWPIGDPRKEDFGFCGADALQGRPYCQAHSARAYQGE